LAHSRILATPDIGGYTRLVKLNDLDATDNPALKDLIHERIRASGPISFAEFYELAMYHPRHGYYFRNDSAQDFQSSPNVHSVFGAVIARQLADFWRLMDRPARFDAFEAGAGSGRLAADVLRYARSVEPDFFDAVRYVIQDVTLVGNEGTRRLDDAGVPIEKVSLASSLPDSAQIEGCILSNELLDALPFRRVRVRGGHLYELMVGLVEGHLVDVEAEPRPELTAHFQSLAVLPGEGCEAEVSLTAPAWMTRAAAALKRGFVLTLDYGYEAEELYAPFRRRGTLLTFYRHTSGDDPYVRIGRQDITASVDFTSVRRASESAGLSTLLQTTQSDFKAGLGVGEALMERPQAGQLAAYYALRRAVLVLTDSAGLGRIKVLIMGKDVPAFPS
jgi:SAM-dependent MidA family methyltransferase